MSRRSKGGKSKAPSDEQAIFKEHDLVGAKVKGHPLWPGQIEKVEYVKNKRKYTVRFFASNDTGHNFIQLKAFKDMTEQERSCNKKGFQEALKLCQIIYNSGQSLEPTDKAFLSDNSESPTTQSSSESQSTAPPSKRIKLSDTKPQEAPEEPILKRLSNTATNDTQQQLGGSKVAKLATKKTSITTTTKTTATSPNSEGENQKVRSLVIRKLSEKIKKKVEEKEAHKDRKKRRKLSDKACEKIEIINQVLERFSTLSKKFSTASNFNQKDVAQCNSAVQKYESVIPVLAKCAAIYTRGDSQTFPVYRKCHAILIDIVENIKSAKKNNKLPGSLRKDLRRCLKLTKHSEEVKEFINHFDENPKQAMIERRDNDSD